MVKGAERELLRQRRLNPGEVLGVVAGTQQTSGSTNFMRLHVAAPPQVQARRDRRSSRNSSFPRRRKT
jgi:hypothetical protein